MQKGMEGAPLTRERIEEAMMSLIECALPVSSPLELRAIFDAALLAAERRFVGEILEAWKEDQGEAWECVERGKR